MAGGRSIEELPEVTFHREPDGSMRAVLLIENKAVSELGLIPFTLQIGAARVRMDGIAGVETDEAHRRRGYSRRVLQATIEQMERGDAALSMLYGIPDFYPKFGFATAGPNSMIIVREPEELGPLPAGWACRRYESTDFPAVRDLYDRQTRRAVGAAVRTNESESWSYLREHGTDAELDDIRVITRPDGRVAAYAWRRQRHWYSHSIQERDPDAFLMAELMAESPGAADAALCACAAWMQDLPGDGPGTLRRLLLSLPLEGFVAAAARRQTAEFTARFSRCGDSMARVIHLQRLFESLKPELALRAEVAAWSFNSDLRIITDIGEVTLSFTNQEITVSPRKAVNETNPSTVQITIRQHELARLALGAFPPDELLDRLENPPSERAREIINILFPGRHPHLYIPDRF
jgi:GNAT superfamily N-acetyltransferase